MSQEFGALLRELREKSGRSMGQLARHLGVSVPYVSEVENGNKTPFTQEKVLLAAEFIGADPTPLLRAAIAARRSVELAMNMSNQRSIDVGAALARRWSGLTDAQIEEIAEIVETGRRSR